MSAFAVMAAGVFADPNIGVDVSYAPAAGGDALTLRAIPAPGPDGRIGTFETVSRAAPLSVDVLARDVAQPAEGDVVTWNTETFEVADFAADLVRATWRLTLRRPRA
jgi:hypothetical protein